jgi:sugar O-acyltransferase (sialic acid O-acetyltransferase NeuD family)
MIVLGAGGHAKEILDILIDQNFEEKIAFYDNVTDDKDYPSIFKNYERLKTAEELDRFFKIDNKFILGVGDQKPRQILRELAQKYNGQEQSFIAENAHVSDLNTTVGTGVSILSYAYVSADVTIGNGVLINTRSNIHHDVEIGAYSEIGPSSILLGKCKIGKNVFIGAGAIILPNVLIEDYCIVGAGTIVTKNVPKNSLVKGNPGKYSSI